MPLKSSDVIFVTGNKSIFHKLIGWFTRTRDEPKTIAKHVAGMLNEAMVIEALWRVTKTSSNEWFNTHENFEVWRNKSLSSEDRVEIASKVVEYDSNFYGFWKLFLHGADLLVEKIVNRQFYFFRKIMFSEDYPICSWLWALPYYKKAGISFGTSYRWADPDSMRDHVSKSDEWEMVHKISNGNVAVNRLK